MNSSVTNLEKESLEAHVDLCAMRYETLEKRFEQVEERLDKIEEKVNTIHDEIRNGNKGMIKVLITTAGTILVGLISTIAVLLQ
jgi:tetrahydromethanopterin S-methyltransferase subunit G